MQNNNSKQQGLGHQRLRGVFLGLLLAGLCPAGLLSCDDSGGHANLSAPMINALPLTTGDSVQRLIVLGDSISAGNGASHPSLSYAALLYKNDQDAYPHEKGRDLVAAFGDDLQYINVAHPGDEAGHVLRQQLPRLIADNPADPGSVGPEPMRGHTVVVMTIGGNDMRHQMGPLGDTSGSVLDCTTSLIRQIIAFFGDAQRFPEGVTFYYGTVYDITDGTNTAHLCMRGLVFPNLSESLRVWREAYYSLATETHSPSVTVVPVDLLETFHGHGFHYADPHNPHYNLYDPSLWFSERDCIHPNDRGHHEARAAFYRAIVAP